ncbi:hypothetical protein phytr_11830 [Candidatus Phycorickettsia trachydisci]|uniref:N-acetylmuramoyl-L-alanine amidase n=1 Tax=Candidatus Phycorickettsia trachydisci TaxID=2115978 RepID=A0A2P1PA17_9RICK|nr:N-acetylmuramoyl-L-alanine amidase [Candidatus Phycorickettsia trachydisci]AVP88108.1 hypothetical protein phytr_11830 [Candidatus Phycorickettsia trachydisci]
MKKAYESLPISTEYQSPNYTHKIECIVQHHTVADFRGTLDIFLTPDKVSAHYVIDKTGNVYNLVPDTVAAWHAGVGEFTKGSKFNPKGRIASLNLHSIGIENVNTGNELFPEEQMRSNAYLLNILHDKYKFNPLLVVGHSDWAPGRKIDPSPFFPWAKFARASHSAEGFGTEMDFGAWAFIDKRSNVDIISWQQILASQSKDEVESTLKADIQSKLSTLGYVCDTDQKLQDAILAFNIHYGSEEIVKLPHFEDHWNKIYESNTSENREPLVYWSDTNDKIMGEIFNQFDAA